MGRGSVVGVVIPIIFQPICIRGVLDFQFNHHFNYVNKCHAVVFQVSIAVSIENDLQTNLRTIHLLAPV